LTGPCPAPPPVFGLVPTEQATNVLARASTATNWALLEKL